ncbi:galactosyltransferase-related protein [Rhizobium mongolense]|uniref:Glycosyltransferase involved in capsule biosynthesis n=2 Tax=Rhizobium mongolense TaxID=57676 RepID=A0ABR6IVU3_9HYPH|nr:galactosyltransferase-related protein [Rhizobium mongolense]MBB4231785.1 putative glycosyltransferase involved in capsule biosynthesis [Rhizobium mongolense]
MDTGTHDKLVDKVNSAAGARPVKVGPEPARVVFAPSFDDISTADITMTFCIRLHKGNPWLADRLDMMASYYAPCPSIVVIDFGSAPEYASIIKKICQNRGYKYLFIDDFHVFSLAKARNASFGLVETNFAFFCDPDFVGERDLFARLAQNASALNMRNVVDIVLNLPAFHLDEDDTLIFEGLADREQRSSFLRYLSFKLNYAEVSAADGRFVAPYSNVFLINRNMFNMVGGYDESFRGHGSEDFEFLLRLAIHTGHLPLPNEPQKDSHGPLKDAFFRARSYSGFRRMFELMSQPTEGLGLKVFHLHHPRGTDPTWYGNNDWRRDRFSAATGKFLFDHHRLLEIDHLPRNKKIACLCKNSDTWGYFTPLRLAGYETIPVFDDRPATVEATTQALINGEIDDIAIFNPYMKSHSSFRGIVMLARELNRNVVVIERGALPSTIYYDDDVCYNSDRFSPDEFVASTFTEAELVEARDYVRDLRLGSKSLEAMDAYDTTAARHSALSAINGRSICLVPLQLEDDMAVTMFIKGKQRYQEFVDSLPSVTEQNPDVIFVVKPHPLSKTDNLRSADNVIIAERTDNIHFLLDLADVTLCYNSGVGLLSILQGTPTVTLGNAFYNMEDIGHRASSAAEGVKAFKEGGVPKPSEQMCTRLAAWFTQRRYSEFIATDAIREFETRRSHGYKDITVTKFRWREHSYNLARLKQTAPFSWKSYAASRIAPSSDPADWNDEKSLKQAASKAFHSKRYDDAARLFAEAHKVGKDKAKLLRFAAEANYRAGDKKTAVAQQEEACSIIPKNKRARRRLMVMRTPVLRYVIGANIIDIPEP